MNYALTSTRLNERGPLFRQVLGFPVLLAGATFTVLAVAGVVGYRVNLTPSMRLGIWRMVATSEYPRGAAVAVCLPVDAPFRPRGSCPLGMQPLLTQIKGVPGDVVTVMPAGVSINGGPLLPHSAPLSHTPQKPERAADPGDPPRLSL